MLKRAVGHSAPSGFFEVARYVWFQLALCRLTVFESPLERLHVSALALGLARTLRYCIPTEAKCSDEDLADWATLLGVAPTHVADLKMGEESHWSDPFAHFEEILEDLVQGEQSVAVGGFLDAYGGTTNVLVALINRGLILPSGPHLETIDKWLRDQAPHREWAIAPQEVHVVGVDLAWSPKNATGLAAAMVSEGVIIAVTTALAYDLDEILEFVRPFATTAITVAIDAPTVVPHLDSMRECEKLLHKDAAMRAANACPYPGTRRLLGKHNGGQPRGEELVERLKLELGFEEIGCPPTGHAGRFAMEVFPSAALVRLFDLKAPLPYKKKRDRTWEQCQAGLETYLTGLRALDCPKIEMPRNLAANRLQGKALKNVEDRVDAVLCAYVAALAWLGHVQCVGSLAEGYIILPD